MPLIFVRTPSIVGSPTYLGKLQDKCGVQCYVQMQSMKVTLGMDSWEWREQFSPMSYLPSPCRGQDGQDDRDGQGGVGGKR